MKYFTIEKKIYLKSIKVASFAVFWFFNISSATSQTTVFSDDYERTQLRKGGTPIINYQVKTTDANGSNYQIFKNVVVLHGRPGSERGKASVSGSLENWAAPFKNVLGANNGTITWSFLLRSTTFCAGFAADQYAAAVVLACDKPDFTANDAKGYAVYISKGKLRNTIHFGEFSNGLGDNSNINSLMQMPDMNTNMEHASIKISFNPANNTWTLYGKYDKDYTEESPASVSSKIESKVVNSALKDVPMNSFGYFFNYQGAANQAKFDSFKVTVN